MPRSRRTVFATGSSPIDSRLEAPAIGPALQFDHAAMGSANMVDDARAASERLLRIASGDMNQPRRVANFIRGLVGTSTTLVAETCSTSSLWTAISPATWQRRCIASPNLQSRNIGRPAAPRSRTSSGSGGRRLGRTQAKPPDIEEAVPVVLDPGAMHESVTGHSDPCHPVFPSSFRSAGSPVGFVALVNRRPGASRPLSRRVAAGTADLGKAGPRPAQGLKSPACPQTRSARSGSPGP